MAYERNCKAFLKPCCQTRDLSLTLCQDQEELPTERELWDQQRIGTFYFQIHTANFDHCAGNTPDLRSPATDLEGRIKLREKGK